METLLNYVEEEHDTFCRFPERYVTPLLYDAVQSLPLHIDSASVSICKTRFLDPSTFSRIVCVNVYPAIQESIPNGFQ